MNMHYNISVLMNMHEPTDTHAGFNTFAHAYIHKFYFMRILNICSHTEMRISSTLSQLPGKDPYIAHMGSVYNPYGLRI